MKKEKKNMKNFHGDFHGNLHQSKWEILNYSRHCGLTRQGSKSCSTAMQWNF